MSFVIILLIQLNYAVKRSKSAKKHVLWYLCTELAEKKSFVTFSSYSCNKRKTFKSSNTTICDTCAQYSLRYEFCYNFAHTVKLCRKTFKSAKTTFCDTCAQSSQRYEFCDIFLHTVVKSRKTVKSTRNTICDTCAQNSRRYEFCYVFLYIVVTSPRTVK